MIRRISIIAIGLVFSFNSVIASSLIKPESAENYAQAVAAFEANELPKAQQLFETVLNDNEDNLDAIVYLARTLARSNELEDAEDYIEKALKIAPENAFVQNLSGKIYASIAQDASIFTAMGYAKDSLRGFKKAAELAPDIVDYRMDLIGYYLGAPEIAGGDQKQALVEAKAVEALDKKQGYLALMNVYAFMDDDSLLVKHLNEIPVELASDADIFYKIGLQLQTRKDYENAVLHFQKAMELAGDAGDFRITNYSALYQIGKTSVLTEQNLQLGYDALKRFLAEAPEADKLPSKEWAEFRLANVLDLQKEHEQAVEIYRRLVSQTKDKDLKKQAKQKI